LIEQILKTCRTIAVVGLSDRPDRPSYGVAQYMQSKGYRVIPVNPNAAEILGEKSYASLLDIPHEVDIVNVFRRTEDVLPIAQQAVQIKAKCLWQQIGIANEEADVLAKDNGLFSVMDLCLKIEHRLLTS
jgi:uncharacterized protein